MLCPPAMSKERARYLVTKILSKHSEYISGLRDVEERGSASECSEKSNDYDRDELLSLQNLAPELVEL